MKGRLEKFREKEKTVIVWINRQNNFEWEPGNHRKTFLLLELSKSQLNRNLILSYSKITAENNAYHSLLVKYTSKQSWERFVSCYHDITWWWDVIFLDGIAKDGAHCDILSYIVRNCSVFHISPSFHCTSHITPLHYIILRYTINYTMHKYTIHHSERNVMK